MNAMAIPVIAAIDVLFAIFIVFAFPYRCRRKRALQPLQIHNAKIMPFKFYIEKTMQ